MARFGLWSGELKFVDRLLDADVRNNSAWNHRFFALSQQGLLQSPAGLRVEVDRVFQRIALAVQNESPWNFLVGLTAVEGCGRAEVDYIEQHILTSILPRHPNCSFALSALIDLTSLPTQEDEAAAAVAEQRKSRARAACDRLAVELDPIRSAYWRLRKNELGPAREAPQPGSSEPGVGQEEGT